MRRGRARAHPRAGRAGAKRSCATPRRTGAYEPVGFLDEPRSRGSKVQGVPVLGQIAELVEVARETAARLIVIAMRPSVHRHAAAARGRCVRAHGPAVPHGAAPGRHARRSVAAGRAEGSRDRGPARSQPGDARLEVDPRLARRARGAVTGGGGSIGAELCRQCAKHGGAVGSRSWRSTNSR